MSANDPLSFRATHRPLRRWTRRGYRWLCDRLDRRLPNGRGDDAGDADVHARGGEEDLIPK
jgi:hypothetical protein